MKKIISLLIIVFVLFLNSESVLLGDNTVNYVHPVINISSIDEDWNDGEERKVQYIIFVPGAADNILVIKQTSATGPEIVNMESSDAEPRIAVLGGTSVDMFLDYDACTLSAGSKVIILLWER